MKFLSILFIVSSLAIASNGMASVTECTLPNSPIVPDGNVASKDELLSARESYKEFESNILDYRECLTAEELKVPADSSTLEAQKQEIIDLDNASIDYLTEIAEELNKAVRAFNNR